MKHSFFHSFIHTYIHTYMYTYIHTCIHMHSYRRIQLARVINSRETSFVANLDRQRNRTGTNSHFGSRFTVFWSFRALYKSVLMKLLHNAMQNALFNDIVHCYKSMFNTVYFSAVVHFESFFLWKKITICFQGISGKLKIALVHRPVYCGMCLYKISYYMCVHYTGRPHNTLYRTYYNCTTRVRKAIVLRISEFWITFWRSTVKPRQTNRLDLLGGGLGVSRTGFRSTHFDQNLAVGF